ncbi:MAG: hypothetical protein H0T93_13820 [Chloroflexia bacterium]|nr:hypothetical protein [Chloroflexia bacterium]
MSTQDRIPFDPNVTEEEMRQLDVDLHGVWSGVIGEIWSTSASRVERLATSILRSPALARALVTTPSLILSWILASAAVFAIGAFVANATEMPIVPLLAPAVAGVAVAFAYGAGADPTYEISRTMPTSARMILLLRVSVVFLTNAILGITASLAVPSLAEVTWLWLLPMVAISLLGLATAVVSHSATIGGGAALAVWSAIVLANEIRADEFGRAVSGATLELLAPMYLLMMIVSLCLIAWMSGDGSKRRELAGWL